LLVDAKLEALDRGKRIAGPGPARGFVNVVFGDMTA
jgi:hypothetical protein